MRLFVAILPPPEALAELDAAVAPLREQAVGERVDPRVRWVRSEQWHVTLAFLGEVSAPAADAVAARLARVAARRPPLVLALAGGGRFSDRVLWTGVTEWRRGPSGAGDETGAPGSTGPAGRLRRADPADVRALAASVRAAARRCGIPGQEAERRYRPHLTLARGRPGADLAPLAARLACFSGAAWPAEELHLVRSELNAGPGGTARHTVHGTWAFTGDQPGTGSNQSRPS